MSNANDFVLEKKGNDLILKKYNGAEEHVVIPEGVTHIGNKAF